LQKQRNLAREELEAMYDIINQLLSDEVVTDPF
jgi:hypothetical protein